jgi:large subunit ribosomal protein L23
MIQERLLNILVAPHISEKSTVLAEKNKQFVFRVAKDATTEEVKKAVEAIFNVKVADVRVLNTKGKTRRRFKGGEGKTSKTKKAYVALQDGFDIDFMRAIGE